LLTLNRVKIKTMIFSILIPSIPSRLHRLEVLFAKLQNQVSSTPFEVEILSLLDNKKRSIGLKRDALVRCARGDYLAFCDDDDDVSEDYVKSICEALLRESPDVLVFNERCSINGENDFIVRFGMEYENEEARQENGVWVDVKRKPFHCCVWKSSIARSESFPDASYGEDWHWCKRLVPKVEKQWRIDRVLKMYRYDRSVTEAELVFPK